MQPKQPIIGRPRARRGGFSMMMVIAVVAVAAILAMAVLSSNTLQAKASSGRAAVVQADSLAESGLNRALYYAHNIDDGAKCPIRSLAVGATYRESDVSLGPAVSGTFDLSIERRTQNRYYVEATGKVGPAATPLRRTVTAFVDVNYNLWAMAFGADVTLPVNTTVIGDIYCDGNLINNGTVEGTVYAKTVTGIGSQTEKGLLNDVVDAVTGIVKSLLSILNLLSPDPINHYTTYAHNGKTYSAKSLSVSSLSNTTLNPDQETNPAGIFYKTGTLDLNGNVTINGTLIVMGNLRVQGPNNVVNAPEGYPALIVDDDLMFKQPASSLEVWGFMHFGGRLVKASGSVVNSNFRVNGALYNPGHGATTFDPVFGKIYVKFDRARSSVKGWNLDYPNPQPSSVTILSWKTE
jgi:Tfp pilus assembly protein PilE